MHETYFVVERTFSYLSKLATGRESADQLSGPIGIARVSGEVATPALEYEAVLRRGDPEAARPAYRFFDEDGRVLVLRSDMTIPIARVVATRYGNAEPPLRFSYFAHAYRDVRQGPDGAIYLLTDNAKGRILKLVPKS